VGTRDLIADLRAGRVPDAGALRSFAAGLADGRVSDAQAGAFAMAVCLNGLGPGGAVALTEGMRDSGKVLDWDLPGPVVDKHSTGGVGDPVSLVLAPALAALGCYVPMISGRGLGHSGGTLDKLQSIPGFAVDLELRAFRDVVAGVGCAIVAASADIAPADRRLYAVRDVTATVDSIELITASILSKKLAGGIAGLVLDVKVGSGAFMGTLALARALAQSLVGVANGAGCPAMALITDMHQPLAPALGNALEVAEVMRVLDGAIDTPLAEVTLRLGAALLVLAGQARDETAARAALRGVLAGGQARDRFGAMVAAQGGPVDFVRCWADHLPTAPMICDVPAPMAGHVAAIDGVALGLAVVRMGGGRQVETDRIDPAVGLSHVIRLGAAVQAGAPLARVHATSAESAAGAVAQVQAAIVVGAAPKLPPLIHEVVR